MNNRFLLLASGLALACFGGTTSKSASRVPAQDPAKDLLLQVRKHYGELKLFEARIVHHNSSGLFPGDYEQRLVWTGKHTFDLTVTEESNYKPDKERPGMLAPDYQAKDGKVTFRRPNGAQVVSSVVPDPNTMPGWEVSGGFALTFLESTASADFFTKPPPGMEAVLSMGSQKIWQDRAVREIVLNFKAQNQTLKLSLFVDGKRPLFVGYAMDDGGWMLYDKVRAE